MSVVREVVGFPRIPGKFNLIAILRISVLGQGLDTPPPPSPHARQTKRILPNPWENFLDTAKNECRD